jgi:hypothetical protein
MIDQEQWAKACLQSLLESDHRHIFILAMYIPSEKTVPGINPEIVSERCFRTDQPLDLVWYIEKESLAEAGSMAVSGKHLPTAL